MLLELIPDLAVQEMFDPEVLWSDDAYRCGTRGPRRVGGKRGRWVGSPREGGVTGEVRREGVGQPGGWSGELLERWGKSKGRVPDGYSRCSGETTPSGMARRKGSSHLQEEVTLQGDGGTPGGRGPIYEGSWEAVRSGGANSG